ncbi:MAG: D-allulose-6-phosphate 3-epimerase [Alphaproteobacteria bacterium]|nr:D-allulose-6-phosphate 3-epimerase [Alphaproteobacteria bacterium]
MTTAHWIDALPSHRLICEFSAWSADLLRLADDMQRIASHCDILHVDVADGHFAPALLFFPDLVAALRKASRAPLHTHLMAADEILLDQITQFADAGSDLISIHAENANIGDALDLLEERRIPAGLVLKVDTPLEVLPRYLPRLRFVTLLGTAIGIKGVGLDPRATGRLTAARALIAAAQLPHRVVLASDGGNREQTLPLLRQAGAETVVLGSLAFGAPSLKDRMDWVHGL